jgi:energy-coupling factor transporter transmembrane protein EcfT
MRDHGEGEEGEPGSRADRPGPRGEREARAARNVAELKGSYRYGLVLMLAVLSTGVQMALPDTPAAWLLQALLMGATVITALFAEDATRKQWRQVGWLIGLSLLGAFVAALTGSNQSGRGVTFGLSGVLAIAGAVIVARGVVGGIRLERRVTLHSVMGALTVYLLAGLIFAFAYSVMGAIAGSPVLSHIGSDKHAEEVYFSFITLTTVGYGDIAPIAAASRMTSVLEALFGQLYLVTIVAVIVSNVGAVRMRHADPGEGG